MWFEIIPAFAIIVGTMAAPQTLAYVMNWIANRNVFRRNLTSEDLRMQYLRDIRIAGDPYKVAGDNTFNNIINAQLQKECKRYKYNNYNIVITPNP